MYIAEVAPHLVTSCRRLDERTEAGTAAMVWFPTQFRRLISPRGTTTLDSGQAIVLQALANRDPKYKTSCVICNILCPVHILATGHAVVKFVETLRFLLVSVEFVYCDDPFGRTMVLGSTQPLTEKNSRNIFWGVRKADAWGWQPYHLLVPIVLKSGRFILLEPTGPLNLSN